MTQASIVIANASGAAVRSAINSANEAITTLQSGASAPSTTYPFMLWADTANDLLKQRNAANSAWITKGTLSAAYGALPASSITYAAGSPTILSSSNVQAAIDELAAGRIFSSSYTSSNQTITSGGSLTLAHGLGGMPSLIQTRLKCLSAQINYSTGDEILIDTAGGAPSANRGIMVLPDATNINIRFGSDSSVVNVIDKTSGSSTGITNSSWALIIRAWR